MKRLDNSTLEAIAGAMTEAKAPKPTRSDEPGQRLLVLLQGGELSSGRVRELVGIKHPPTFRQNYRHPALKSGLIEYTVPEKPNNRLRKYRFTSPGERALMEQQGEKAK